MSRFAHFCLLPVLGHTWYGWREDETGIYAELQIASMPFKANFARMKDGRPKRFWIEVGAHAWENLQFSPGFAKSEDDSWLSSAWLLGLQLLGFRVQGFGFPTFYMKEAKGLTCRGGGF